MLHIAGRAIVCAMVLLPVAALIASSPRAAEPPEGRWVWGDLHAHSGWSFDGCEDADALCAPRGDLPASDFFAQAEALDLDFAALTDHAEAGTWSPDGGEVAYQVWEGQAEAVGAAQGGATLPVLGYEWTSFRDEEERGHPLGSHRTVLLSVTEPCTPARVAGFMLSGGERVAPDALALYTQVEDPPVREVSALWEALDAAAQGCGGLRWISFAHHSAYTNPQETDWKQKENRPDRETLVEIASEHGSSECSDPGAEGCGWWLNAAQGYWPDGSVQTALDEGFTLGFTGGTDSHDARPGSLSDGPGAVGHLDDGQARIQFARGALTGAFLQGDSGAGAPEVDALFDALEARHTVATTGPRPELTVYALGADGEIYLPGELLPPSARPAELHLDLGELAPTWTLRAVEAIGPGGEILASSEVVPWSLTWDGRAGDWVYLRLRFDTDAWEDGEDRLWISPWFGARRCGCATGGEALGLLPAWIALIFARRRRSA